MHTVVLCCGLQAAERGRNIQHKYDLLKMHTVAQDVKKGLSSLRRSTLKHLDLASDVQNWDTAVRVRVGGFTR